MNRLASLLGFLLLWSAAVAAPPNLVSKPGFESNLTGWNSYIGGTAQAVTTSPHSGSKAGRSTNRTATNNGLRTSVLSATPGKCYLASGWVRTSSATADTVYIAVRQIDGRGTNYYFPKSIQVADTWTYISGIFRYDPTGTVTGLDLAFNGPAVGVDLFVDDVSFTAVDTTAIENLLTNSDFESGAMGWVAHGGSTVAATTSAHTGAGAVLVSNRTATWHGVDQSVFGKTEDGRMYAGAGWVTTDSATADTVKLTLQVDDSSGTRFFTIATGTASSAGWTWLYGTVTMPATTGLTSVKFFVEGPASGVALRFDNAYFAPITGLRRAAAAYPALRLGAGGNAVADWADNSAFRAAVSAHFHLVSPGNALKFDNTEKTDNVWTFAEANSINDLALARGGSSRGHTFVWHSAVPTWVTSGGFTAAQLQTLLWDHIDTEAAAFRNRLCAWDVANEAFADSGAALRSTLWYNTPGIGYAANGNQYLSESFLRARAADANTPLFYNDFNIEDVNTKSDAVYSMASNFLSAGVPINGIGFQSHFASVPSGTSLRTNFQRFQDLGLDLHVTELDLRLPVDANGNATAANLTTQGDNYFNYLSTALGYSRMKVFQTWGVYDGASWVPGFYTGYGQALPFDFNLDRKPAYWGLWNALAGQCENLPVLAISAGDSHSVLASTLCKANACRKLTASGTNDFITLQAHVPFAGTWSLTIGVLKFATAGRFQLAIAPPGSSTFTNVGSVQDLYAAANTAANLSLGNQTFGVAGDWQFRFTIPSKNAASTGYDLGLDYIRITPVSCSPAISALPDQTIAVNGIAPARLFIAEDDTAQGSLQVTATSDNPPLLPNSAITLTGDSPYYTLAATPAADQLGTATVSVTASDGTLSYTRTFALNVTGTPSQTWRQQYFGTAANTGTAADLADYDGDGIANLAEYALAMNPTQGDPPPLIATKTTTGLDFIYTKNKAATDVTFIVEWSDTLNGIDWSTAGVSAPTILSDNGTTQQIKVTVPAASGVPRRFVRLKVTRP